MDRDSDVTGRGGRAWKVEPPADSPPHAQLSAWALHQPGVHAFWSWWSMTVAHLRPIEGLAPAHLQYTGAEYEIIFAALRPEDCPPKGALPRGMEPFDLVFQFHGVSDEGARELLNYAIRLCCAGSLAADCDFRAHWSCVLPEELERIKAREKTRHEIC